MRETKSLNSPDFSSNNQRRKSATECSKPGVIQQIADASPQSKASETLQRMADQHAMGIVQMKQTHTVKKSTTPYIHAFTEMAMDKGAPSTLTYYINKTSEVYVQNIATGQFASRAAVEQAGTQSEHSEVTIRDVNRAKVFSRGVELSVMPSSHNEKTSRDEYPYASTAEGGADGFWARVPVSEQNRQGGQLAGVYGKMKNGEEFDVKLAD